MAWERVSGMEERNTVTLQRRTTTDIYSVEFAPDGKHFQGVKKGKIDKMWDYFNTDPYIRNQLALNPQAKIRLRNMNTNKIIGILPRKR